MNKKRNSISFMQSKHFVCLCVGALICFSLTLLLLWTVRTSGGASTSSSTTLPIRPLHVEYQKTDFLCDNIHETCYNEYLYLPMIDVVYTWVNGSDPWLRHNLELTKLKLNVSGVIVEPADTPETDTNSTLNTTGKAIIDERLSASRFQGK